ncbi:hypothetical protein MTO96_030233 [Rhipicephalus appendiculatus]
MTPRARIWAAQRSWRLRRHRQPPISRPPRRTSRRRGWTTAPATLRTKCRPRRLPRLSAAYARCPRLTLRTPTAPLVAPTARGRRLACHASKGITSKCTTRESTRNSYKERQPSKSSRRCAVPTQPETTWQTRTADGRPGPRAPFPLGGSNASKINKAAVGPVEGGASTDNKKRKETRSAKRSLEIACPSCNFTAPHFGRFACTTSLSTPGSCSTILKTKKKKVRVGKQSASTKSRHTPSSKAKARHAIEERQASDDSRSKKSFTAHDYQQDGFVCSDRSSLESDDEDSSTLTPALSPHSDADASWRPSERSGDTVQEEEDSGSGVDNEESHLSCERCQESFVSKLVLAIHMSRSHRVSFFCTYCFRGAKRVDILRLHQEREHRQLPFLYRTLEKLRLVTVGVDSDESNEDTVASERPIGRSIRHPTRHRHRIVPKSVPRSS